MPERNERERRSLMAQILSGVGRRITRPVRGVRDLFTGNFREAAGNLIPAVGFAQDHLGLFDGQPGWRFGQSRDFNDASADMAQRMNDLLNPPGFSEESAEMARRMQEALDRGRGGPPMPVGPGGPQDARTAFSGSNPYGSHPAGVSWLGMDVRGAVAGPRGNDFRPRIHTK